MSTVKTPVSTYKCYIVFLKLSGLSKGRLQFVSLQDGEQSLEDDIYLLEKTTDKSRYKKCKYTKKCKILPGVRITTSQKITKICLLLKSHGRPLFRRIADTQVTIT